MPHHVTRRGNRRQQTFFCEEELDRMREHERTGRPLGDEDFLGRLEKPLGRVLRRQKPGRKRKHTEN